MLRRVLCTAAAFILCAAGTVIKDIPAAAIELSAQREQQPEAIMPQHCSGRHARGLRAARHELLFKCRRRITVHQQ